MSARGSAITQYESTRSRNEPEKCFRTGSVHMTLLTFRTRPSHGCCCVSHAASIGTTECETVLRHVKLPPLLAERVVEDAYASSERCWHLFTVFRPRGLAPQHARRAVPPAP